MSQVEVSFGMNQLSAKMSVPRHKKDEAAGDRGGESDSNREREVERVTSRQEAPGGGYFTIRYEIQSE